MSAPQLPPVIHGAIAARVVSEFLASSGMTINELMLALVPQAQAFARPSISNFLVGAVAQGASGGLYFGANYEFVGQALSFTVHGEQAATAHAITNGETGMQRLAVSAAPCGYCRQFLYELNTASTLQILLPNTPAALLTSLLPDAFGPKDLSVTAALMSPQAHGLLLPSEIRDPVAEAALGAANSSYAPYTSAFAGVALKTVDGNLFTGSVAENAAYNPSMSPLEAALVSLVISGGKSYSDIVDAVLVQAEGAPVSQLAVTRAVLESITSVKLRAYQAQTPHAKEGRKHHA